MDKNSCITDDDTWEVVKAFYDKYGTLYHQIESYNNAMLYQIPNIINTNKKFEILVSDGKSFIIEFGEVKYERPVYKEIDEKIRSITPKECIDRDITYQAAMYIDVEYTTPYGYHKIIENVFVGNIPVMVKSELCNLYDIRHDKEKLASIKEDIYDPGGYFIIKGACKAISSQERTAYNKIYVFKLRKSSPKYEYYAEVRSCMYDGTHSTTVSIGIKNKIFSVIVPYIESSPIPLGIIFKALGVKSSKEIMKYIYPKEEYTLEDKNIIDIITPSLEQSWDCTSQESALLYIGKRGKKFTKNSTTDDNLTDKVEADAISYTKHLLCTEFIPHIGTTEKSFKKKAFYIGYMTLKVIKAKMGLNQLEDRDHFANKRISTTGILLVQQFYNAFRKFKSEIIINIERAVTNNNSVNILSYINPKIITSSIIGAIVNNNWGRGKSKGISQSYERFNHAAGIANLRKISIPMNEGGKVEAPRKLHSSHWGIICPWETPEGKKCGLVKSLALGCVITVGSNHVSVYDIIYKIGCDRFDTDKLLNTPDHSLVIIFVNGDIVGTTQHPLEFIKTLRELRRSCSINPEISISYNPSTNEINISTDGGRAQRPLFIVEDGNLKINKNDLDLIKNSIDNEESAWTYLMYCGFVEFIDKLEEEEMYIVTYPSDLDVLPEHKRMKVTHCEINPNLIMGVGASRIPFSNHNQAPRLVYQASMGKQAVGCMGSNYMFQTKTKFHNLNYPQLPITTTRISNIFGFNDLPTGHNAVVALCPYYGFGQEDSIIVNKDSVDRGFMNITTYIPFTIKIRPDKKELIEVPLESECNNFRGNPRHLNSVTGIVEIGQVVQDGDILIGCTLSVHSDDPKPKRNISVIYDHAWPGKVHLIQRDTNEQGYEYIHIIIIQDRKPVFGDKFASMSAQKGTVGILYPSCDMPFNSQGIAPDILMNPLALPSRMTIGMLIEMLTGKKICVSAAISNLKVSKVFNIQGDEDEDDECVEPYNYSSEKSKNDATAFSKDFNLSDICKELKSLGYDEFGDEQYTNGITGEPMKCLIFTGVCYYQRLKHMVIDKVHARSRGGKTLMCHQPGEGRKVGGGLKNGHMERDCLMAHGASGVIKDRMVEQSDEYEMWYCKQCGMPAYNNSNEHDYNTSNCRLCQSSELSLVKIPFATKLLQQEFGTMNVMMNVMTK